MGVLPEVLAGANNDINTVNTGLNSNPDIVHVTSDVSQDLSLQAKLADSLAILAGLLTGARAGELDAVNTEVIEGLGDLDLGLGVEVGVGELLTLTQGRLDDLEVGDVGEEVLGWGVWVCALGVLLGLDLGETIGGCRGIWLDAAGLEGRGGAGDGGGY